MTKILTSLFLCLGLTFSAWADGDHDPYLDQPVVVDQSVDINIDSTVVEILNSPPSLQSVTPPPRWDIPGQNYFYDNGQPLPPPGSLVPVIIPGNFVRIQSGQWNLMTQLMQAIQYELQKQGYNTNLNYYGVQNLRVSAQSFSYDSQVALLQNNHMIASSVIPSQPNIGVPLYNNNGYGNVNLLSWPLNLIYRGDLVVDNVTVFLAPIYPHGGGMGGPVYPPGPIQNWIQLGNTKTYQKRPISNRSHRVTFQNLAPNGRAQTYNGYRHIVVENNNGPFELTQVKVNYVNRHGYVDSVVIASDDRRLHDGAEAYYPIPAGVSIISVVVSGYSPKVTGGRARVRVLLRR